MPAFEENVKKYAAMSEQYEIPADAEGVGQVMDEKTDSVLFIGFVTHIDMFKRMGYICSDNELLKACASALIEAMMGKPVMHAYKVTPQVIFDRLCPGEEPDEMTKRMAAMAVTAIGQGLLNYAQNRKGVTL